MDTVRLGTLDNGAEVHMDAEAAGADATIVVNRVKPHTAFRGRIESGLCKMTAIGLGKQRGAEQMHAYRAAESCGSHVCGDIRMLWLMGRRRGR